VQVIQERQGLKISCIEEIAYRMGYINKGELTGLASEMMENEYGRYLMNLIDEE